MSSASRLILTGRVFRDEGVIHCEIRELQQLTWGRSLEDVLTDAVRSVTDYFDACAKLGTLAAEFVRLGVAGATPETLGVELTLQVDDLIPRSRSEQRIEFALAS